MLKILFWNPRGAGSDDFRSAVYDLVKINHVDVLAICEPRVQFSQAKKSLLDLGFTDFKIIEARGFSGGLWLLWDKNKVGLDYMDSSSQSISMKVQLSGKPSWLLTVLYASPTNSIRAELWPYLERISAEANLPSVFIGDYNELVSSADKCGGSSVGRFGGLKDWIDRNALIDMGFIGSCFTWSNNRVKERLDRGFCSCSWRALFSEAFIQHLAKTKSDHCPILLQLHSNVSINRNSSPFRFQAMWLSHENYADFIDSSWKNLNGDFCSKVKDLSTALSRWNKDVFGHLFHKKKRLLARIAGIQKARDRFENPFLINLEADLICQYETLREEENMFWRQKSRDSWLQGGDRNTRFFHLTTLVRRRRNKIEGLYDSADNWCADSNSMKSIAVDFFTDLFSQPPSEDTGVTIPRLFPDIDQALINDLDKPISIADVRNALFSIGGLKAPGHDGFPALFFQHHWSLYSSEIFKVVSDAFSSCSIPSGLNHTLIALVPKIDGPQHMINFRPISLCTTTYKIISKIIVSRIRPLMQNLISPNQVSYVPGRNISDNIMVAQEMLYKFKKSTGKNGFFAWKIDLSKAYDKLSWNFIELVLHEANFPRALVKLIMHCITSTSFQICLNGELTSSFMAQRGIRQGDPLSPYIFVLCMEKLSHLIQSAVDDGHWKAVKASQSGPKISHLFFADDLMLFAKASTRQAHLLKLCLDNFCAVSGQTVSYEKSLIFCSPNTPKSMADNISALCGSPLTCDLGKYLGMPLIHSRVNKHTYDAVFDKVQGRLASWKSKVLSMAGRLTLIQSVTSSIPNYAMQTAKFPVSLCDRLDRLNRNFLWGDVDDKKKIHLINWDTVCQPKQLGGLGIKKSADMNQAMLAKISWRMFQNDKGLWATMFSEKYLKDGSIFNSHYAPPNDCSSIWRGVVYGAKLIRDNLKWRVGDGSTIKFWYDHWLGPEALIQHALPNATINRNAVIRDFWGDDGWNLPLLSAAVPAEIISQILNVPTGFDDCGRDTLIWGATSNGQFSVKSAYNSSFDFSSSSNPQWQFIWNLKIPPKLKTFLWTMLHRKLLTNVQRVTRKFSNDASCPICHSSDETLLHLFRDCPRAANIWRAFPMPSSISSSFSLDWTSWINAQLHCHSVVTDGFKWCNLFVFVCWYIWKWRNKQVFDSNFVMPTCFANIVWKYAIDWRKAQNKSNSAPLYNFSMLSWQKPSAGSFKLNIDGTRVSLSGKIGAGGVIRDHCGTWIGGFQVNLGVGDVIQAEAWGLLYGLKLALQLKIDRLEVETDSAVLVNLFHSSNLALHPLGSLIDGCRNIMAKLQMARICHIFRESNMLADALAKHSITHDLGMVRFEGPPAHVAQAFLDDLCSTARARRSACFDV